MFVILTLNPPNENRVWGTPTYLQGGHPFRTEKDADDAAKAYNFDRYLVVPIEYVGDYMDNR